MEIGSTNASVNAIQQAFKTNAERAERISKPELDKQFEKDMAELPSDDKNVGIQAAAIRTKDKMLGDLLDILA